MDIAIRLKKALSEKGWSQRKLCQELNITETGLKYTIDNNSWKVETVDRIASLLELPITYFLLDGEENLDAKSKPADDSFGENVLKDLKAIFEEDMRSKNQTIADLLNTVHMLAGKFEGAIVEPLSIQSMTYPEMAELYHQLVMGEAAQMISKARIIPEAKLVAPHSHSHQMGNRLQ